MWVSYGVYYISTVSPLSLILWGCMEYRVMMSPNSTLLKKQPIIWEANETNIDGLVPCCGISIADALVIPQSCTNPSVFYINIYGSPGLILGLRPANEGRRYVVTMSLIGWAQVQNQPCIYGSP